MKNNLIDYKKTAITGFIWIFLERFGAQSIGIIVSIILARLLFPSDYGIVAITSVFINIMTMFISGGMSIALVQKKNADDLDFSSLFYFNLFMSVLLFLIIYIVSPLLSNFYHMPELKNMIRVNGIMFFISGIRAVQAAFCSRNLLFRNFFFATIGGTLIAAVIGIWMAYSGYGAWALIIQNLSNNAIDAIILWIFVSWRPKFIFSFNRLRKLFRYGWKLLISSILELLYNNIYPLLIGRIYSKSDLAYYTKGQNLPMSLVMMINSALDKVLLPLMSNVQDNEERLLLITRRTLQIGSYCLFPLMMGFATSAENIVRILLTDKWIEIVPFVQVFCIVFMMLPIQTANLNSIKAMGRSDIYLIIEIIKKALSIIILLITIHKGVLIIISGQLIVNILGQIINIIPNEKLLGYKIIQQIKDILSPLLLSCIMCIIIYLLSFLKINSIMIPIMQICIGCIFYICCSVIFNLDGYKYILLILNKSLKK